MKVAMAAWISAALKEGRDIPEPRSESTPSGRLLLRMPRTLHAALTKAAERENVSLNQFITDSLASVVGWRRGPTAGEAGDTPTPINQEPGAAGRGTDGRARRSLAAAGASAPAPSAAAATHGRAHGELPSRRDRWHDRDPRAHRRPPVGARQAGSRRGRARSSGPASATRTSRSPRWGTRSDRQLNGLTRRYVVREVAPPTREAALAAAAA